LAKQCWQLHHLSANGLLIPTKALVDSPTFKNSRDIPSLDVFLDDMKKSTYFPKTTAYSEIGAALRTILAKSWTEGQPARQVLPEAQRELERVLSEAKTRSRN
jgi:hypothetical protein